MTTFVPPARHLLRAKDLADARYFEPLGVDDLARSAGLSRAHFSREFRAAFGESPHSYLLTRRMERAAALLRTTDHSVADVCLSVGLQSIGSFTTSFKRTYGVTPTAYRASFPSPADSALVPACVVRFYGRPQHSTFGEDSARPLTSLLLMIRLSNAQLWVHDQDEALAFWTDKVGMEVRSDVTLPEMGNFRWLAVGPPGQEDVSIVLMAIPGPPVMDDDDRRRGPQPDVEGLRGDDLPDDRRRTASYEDLKGRGVEFTEAPEQRPYGIDAGFRDPSGNSIRLTQVREGMSFS